jgi:hypothetical protein
MTQASEATLPTADFIPLVARCDMRVVDPETGEQIALWHWDGAAWVMASGRGER